MTDEKQELSRLVLERARRQGIMIATAESCTGGLIAAALTNVAGSSDAFDRGFVTYSNRSKQDLLGVKAETLSHYGAVSSNVAEEMAAGALQKSNANISISVTGIAGPGGGTKDKPVGLVWFGLARTGMEAQSESRIFERLDRQGVREAAVRHTLLMLSEELGAQA